MNLSISIQFVNAVFKYTDVSTVLIYIFYVLLNKNNHVDNFYYALLSVNGLNFILILFALVISLKVKSKISRFKRKITFLTLRSLINLVLIYLIITHI